MKKIFLILIVCLSYTVSAAVPQQGVKQIVCETWRALDHGVTKIDNLLTTADGLISSIDAQLPGIAQDYSHIEMNISIIDEALDNLSLTDDMMSVIDEIKSEITTLPTIISRAPYTITQSGSYAVAEKLDGQILIDANYVSLSLNGNCIEPESGSAILVNPGKHHVAISNGFVATADIGVHLAGTVSLSISNIVIEGINTSDCNEGIRCDNCNNFVVRSCLNDGGQYGIRCKATHNGSITDCTMQRNAYAGIFLSQAFLTDVKNCSAKGGVSLSNNVYGFYSERGFGNVFNQCTVSNMVAIDGGNNSAFGIALRGELATTIQYCLIEGIVSLDASSFGIRGLNNSIVSFVESVPGKNLSSSWTTHADYFATGGYTAPPSPRALVNVYSFINNELSLQDNLLTADIITNALSWMPNNYFLAIGGQKEVMATNVGALSVYYFDGSSLQFPAYPATDPGNVVTSVSWSPDGQYLAIGGIDGSNGMIRVYQFTPGFPGTLNEIVALTPLSSLKIQSVSWSPNGQHLAVGGNTLSTSFFTVYEFSGGTLINPVITTPVLSEVSTKVVWSPSGTYIAVLNVYSGISDRIVIWQFAPGAPGSLTELAAYSPADGRMFDIDWSFHEKYLVSGGQSTFGNGNCATYEFIPKTTASELNILSNTPFPLLSSIDTVSLIPNGLFIGMGGVVIVDINAIAQINSIVLKSVLQFNTLKSLLATDIVYSIDASNTPVDSVEPNMIVNNRSSIEYSSSIQHVVQYPTLSQPLDNILY